MRIWKFSNISVEKIIEAHCERVTQPVVDLLNWKEALTCTGTPAEPIWDIVKEGKAMPRKAILYPKFLFLNHIIISRATGCKEEHFPLNSEMLRKVIGDGIYEMLHTLEDMRLILISKDYTPGLTSRRIKLCEWNITHEETDNRKVIAYIAKIRTILERKNRERIESQRIYLQAFIDTYNQSLNYLALTNEQGIQDYLYQREYKSEHQRHYYEACIVRFKERKPQIVSIDKNGRIYHFMTSLPKDLKPYFNIRYSADISNSHPLLYASFFIRHYQINKETLETIFKIPYEDITLFLKQIVYIYTIIFTLQILHLQFMTKRTYDNKTSLFSLKRKIIFKRKQIFRHYIHYVSEQLHNYMKNNDLSIQKGIKEDILVYLHRVMKGKFWDEFQVLFDTAERGEVKANLFREIFYSYATRVVEKRKPYGALFRDMYPNVWHVLRNEKGKEDLLPNQMMKLESQLFSNILGKCYERGWKVFNIHDAVIVLNVPENASCTPENLRAIIEETYHAQLLYPTVSIDMYQTPSDIS